MTLDRHAAERRRFARLLGVDGQLGSGLPIGAGSAGAGADASEAASAGEGEREYERDRGNRDRDDRPADDDPVRDRETAHSDERSRETDPGDATCSRTRRTRR